jgi:2,3-bisphosphoglycerate-dependent phosphoglycerate mutase
MSTEDRTTEDRVDDAEVPEGFRQYRFTPPPAATTVLLVRHGESAPAVPGRPFPLTDGHGDPALHPDGARQAVRVGERLAAEGVDAIYVTTLVRTHQTAAPLAEKLGLEIRVEPDLREVFLGDWEGGLLRERAAANDPAFHQIFVQQRWDVIPNAEPLEAFHSRTQAGIARIVAAHPDQRVAVFTHGGVIGQLLHHATNSERFAFSGADNASISEIVVDQGRHILRRYNDITHLL